MRELRPASPGSMARRALSHCGSEPRASFRTAERMEAVRAVQQPQIRRHRELPHRTGEAHRHRQGGLAGGAARAKALHDRRPENHQGRLPGNDQRTEKGKSMKLINARQVWTESQHESNASISAVAIEKAESAPVQK